MAKLIYSAITSLDGYVEDDQGRFEWATPDEEVFVFVNNLLRPSGIHLYGRRMYETMVYWETADTGNDEPDASRDFAQIWRAAEKIVFSRTLQTVSSARTRIERDLDFSAIRRLKETAESDITIGGAELVGQIIAAGLVDELHLLLVPIIIGGGKPALPGNVRCRLQLIGESRFQRGDVHLHYRMNA